MKKLIIPIGVLLVTGHIKAQVTPLPNTENYVQTKTYLDYTGTQATKSSETVQYFDGLGRAKQTINIKGSPQGKDVVSHIEYDAFGRQVKDYLPVPQSGTQNGAIYTSPLGNAPSVYGSEKIFSEKILENSPLDRIQQQIQVGNDWSAKPVSFGYAANVAGEVYQYVTSTTWENGATKSVLSLASNTTYGANQLYKNTIKDEDGNETIEFKNGQGQVLLVRKVLSSSVHADTYYVYNEYNQLAFVLSPNAVHKPINDDLLNNFCYQYRYDGKGRMVEKRLPGKGWEYMVYDKADRLVLTQDANLRSQGKWMFTKYDQLSRPIYTGILDSPPGRVQQVAAVEGAGANTETRSTSSWNNSGMDVFYTNTGAYPTTNFKLTSINYYDTYPGYTFNPAFPASILGEPTLTETPSPEGRSLKGLPLIGVVKNIEDDNWTKTYTYYDTKGRIVGTHSINHLGGYTRVESQLDFSGAPKKTVTRHLRLATEAGVTISERFVYDSQNRLKEHWHQVDSKPEQLLAQNTYNELSQLSNKKVGNNLQSIDYAYNIRGWMTDVNKDQMGASDLGGKLFSYKIKYTQKDGITNPDTALFPGKDVKARYNGNIAEVDWRAVESLGANPSLTPKRYGYAYDALNRLTAGYYQNPNNAYSKEHTESLAYDLNGNITGLYRTTAIENNNTTATAIDNLEYTYTKGNQVSNIKDHMNNPSGYEGGNGTIEYDLNGNMWKIPDKNISNIKYNYLNLPSRIEYGDLGSLATNNYLFRGDGVKLQKIIPRFECGIINCYTVNSISDYLDGFQYFREQMENGGGTPGGPVESLRMHTEKLKHAQEQQAFTLERPEMELFPDSDGKVGGGNQTAKIFRTQGLIFFPTAEGFYDYTKDQYIYQYKDHLGNVRISFTRNSAGALEITDANDYYPFGMNHLKTGNSFYGEASYKNYKYNGKELQNSGMYDYGARFYMPDIGRWGVTDPLAEQYRRHSVYNYAVNNPIRFIDPDGRGVNDWVRRTGHSNWEYRSDINSEQEAKDAGFVSYANGRGDDNSSYTTTLARNGVDTGVEQKVVLGEDGNYTVDGKAFKDADHYTDMKPVDQFGTFMAAFVAFPLLLEGSPYLVSGGSAKTLLGKAVLSGATQYVGTGDVNLMSVVGDTFGAYGTGEILGGVSELSWSKLRKGQPAFRTVFNGGGMAPEEAASNIGFAFISKGLGKVNGATATGAKGLDKTVVGVNNFLIGTTMYGLAGANASEIQKKQK